MIEKGQDPAIDTPTDMSQEAFDKLTVLKKKEWLAKFERYEECTEKLKNNKRSIVDLWWGQCSVTMKGELKTHSGYETTRASSDPTYGTSRQSHPSSVILRRPLTIF